VSNTGKAMIQSGEIPISDRKNYLILFDTIPDATRGKYGRKIRSVGKGRGNGWTLTGYKMLGGRHRPENSRFLPIIISLTILIVSKGYLDLGGHIRGEDDWDYFVILISVI
jgi:hypothetical protein